MIFLKNSVGLPCTLVANSPNGIERHIHGGGFSMVSELTPGYAYDLLAIMPSAHFTNKSSFDREALGQWQAETLARAW
jgi:hypothetical protein